jgi:S-adenosylmethionine:tRNA ribosyltransferase-isomerase
MQLTDFTYHLPDENIAHRPAEPRDSSKLLHLNRQTGQLQDHIFCELPDLLQPTDVIVRNDTKVIPAKIVGKKSTGGHVELLLLKEITHSPTSTTWECLTKPGLKPGQKLDFPNLRAECTGITGYAREITFHQSSINFLNTLLEIGSTPLPPYIHWDEADPQELREKYQTTYATHAGSAAAPTAGLHFTKELDEKLITKGITILPVTLHVGLGTFLPVKTQDVSDHVMHTEWFNVPTTTATAIKTAKQNHQRIIAVGTTTVRVLESVGPDFTTLQGTTNIFIKPPHQFKVVDGMITNFHLPESTLLMLISAFTTAPQTPEAFTTFSESSVGKAYAHAIKNNYRFFSFGDAMLIL